MAAISRRGCRAERYSTPAGRLNRPHRRICRRPGGDSRFPLREMARGRNLRQSPGVLWSGTTMAENEDNGARWQDQLYDLLRRHNVTQFAYVPDAGHRILIDRSLADPGVHSVALTTEEEGVALLAGADLGGARGGFLQQSSGGGNCTNMLTTTQRGRFHY